MEIGIPAAQAAKVLRVQLAISIIKASAGAYSVARNLQPGIRVEKMAEEHTGINYTRGTLAKLGLITFCFGAGTVAVGIAAGSSVQRWASFLFAYILISISLDYLLLLIPKSTLREILRFLVSLPLGVVMWCLGGVGFVLRIVISIVLLCVFCSVPVTLLLRVAFPHTEGTPVHVYFILLLALTVAAYAQDRILWPLEKIHNPLGDPERRARRDFAISARIIRAVNPRRLAYLFSFLTYLCTGVIKLANVKLSPSWLMLTSVAFEALVGFLAVDTYVSAFHPKLLQRRPLWPAVDSSAGAERER